MWALVGIGITVAVYCVVALIVKADDFDVALATNKQDSAIGGLSRAPGRALVFGMPLFLTCTAAMIWGGGGIVLHGLEIYGRPSIGLSVTPLPKQQSIFFRRPPECSIG